MVYKFPDDPIVCTTGRGITNCEKANTIPYNTTIVFLIFNRQKLFLFLKSISYLKYLEIEKDIKRIPIPRHNVI